MGILSTIILILGLISMMNSQFERIEGIIYPPPQGRCCHTEYVFSIDISGSMNYWNGGNWQTTRGIIQAWMNWLAVQRANSADYYVSAQMFHHGSVPFATPLIHKTPINYNHGQLLYPSGFTDWNHAIRFLTSRLNSSQNDNICYVLITDLEPQRITIDGITASNFRNAYRRWQRKGCRFCFRLIDVRRLPATSFAASRNAQNQDAKTWTIKLADLANELGFSINYEAPTSSSQVSYTCCGRRYDDPFEYSPPRF